MKFVISHKVLAWNELIGKHWTVIKRAKDGLSQATWESLLQSKFKLATFPVSIHYHVKWKGNRRHDIDCLYLKALNDQLVRQGILPDDNLKYVSEVRVTGETGADRDEIIVEIKTPE